MGRPRTGALVSVVERRSRYTVLGVPSKQAEHVAAVTIALLAAHKGHTQTLRPIMARSLPTIPRSAKRWTRPYILPIPTMPRTQREHQRGFANMCPKGRP